MEKELTEFEKNAKLLAEKENPYHADCHNRHLWNEGYLRAITKSTQQRTEDGNKDALITRQQLKIDGLETKNQELIDSLDKINRALVCIGGPLNDNNLRFNDEQIKWLIKLQRLI